MDRAAGMPSGAHAALTAPVVGVIGVRATLVGAALLGAGVTFGAFFLPGMRSPERTPEATVGERALRVVDTSAASLR